MDTMTSYALWIKKTLSLNRIFSGSNPILKVTGESHPQNVIDWKPYESKPYTNPILQHWNPILKVGINQI